MKIFLYFLALSVIINFVLLAVWAWRCRGYAYILLERLGRKTLFSLLIIFCLSFLLRITVVSPKHLIYNDEFYYMQAAKNLLMGGNFGNYTKSLGWPLIIAIMFGIFGINNWVAIYTSIFFGALTSIIIFLLVYFILKDEQTAVLSSLIFACMPEHILWSATAETNAVSLFFITLCILCMLLYFARKDQKLLWLSLLTASFTAQLRGENYILFALFAMGSRILCKGIPKLRTNKDIWYVVTCLSLPNLVHLLGFQFAVNLLHIQSAGSAIGRHFSWHNLYANSFSLAPYLFDASLYPILFIALSIMGFLALWYYHRPCNLFLFLWFAVFYIAYFTFFKTEVFLETRRFFTSFYPILVIWCAGGVWFAVGMIKNLQFKKLGLWSISAVLLISFFPYWDIKKAGGPQHRLETEIIEKAEAQLPPHCVIVANYPEVLSSTTFLRVINIDDFLQDRAFRDDILNHFSCVLFLEDYPCFYFADIINKCEALKSLVRLEPFKSYAIDKGKGGPGKIVYTFYKISPRDK